ncbi:class I SAM-dependent methyltransferase [Bacillus sp. 1P06AnD]|uniref:class I SAM-dependent methyltransferase n=1 Tax=Bacillus sp. 1P06AnD TaxID=3132208 RepID=UPI0039A10CDB
MEKTIKNRILQSKDRMISYEEFIQLALYDELEGYYNAYQDKIGRKADFYTNSNIGSVFGEIIGQWFCLVLKKMKLAPVILELGGGTGKAANDILNAISQLNQDLYQSLSYILIESSPHHRKIQKETLKSHTNAIITDDWSIIRKWQGLMWSNEFFDALPVHVIEKHHGQFYEIMIGEKEGKFREVNRSLDQLSLKQYIKQYGIQMCEGQRIEIPIKMEETAAQIYKQCHKGVLLTIDYGYRQIEWSEPHLFQGSLRGYRLHRMYNDILQQPGKLDITAHIHWDTLLQLGRTYGMLELPLMAQRQFLLNCGILNLLQQQHSLSDPFSSGHKRNRAITSLIDPSGVSSFFQVLIQSKGINPSRLPF